MCFCRRKEPDFCQKLTLENSLWPVPAATQFSGCISDESLRVARQHQRLVEEVKRVSIPANPRPFRARSPRPCAPCPHQESAFHRFGCRLIARRQICHIVRADNQRHIRLREISFDLSDVQQLVVRSVRFRGQYIYVTRHTSRDRMNSEFQVHAALCQTVVQFAHFVLRLCGRPFRILARSQLCLPRKESARPPRPSRFARSRMLEQAGNKSIYFKLRPEKRRALLAPPAPGFYFQLFVRLSPSRCGRSRKVHYYYFCSISS